MSGIAALEGAGQTRVLVLHGWALDSGVWLTTRALTDQARFRYAYVDFPGYGAAATDAWATSLDEMATHALAAADSLGWERFSVLGHSMGGAAAIRLAGSVPDRVDAVVALTPVAPNGTPFDETTFGSFVDAWADPGPVLGGLAPNLSEDQLARLVERNRATMTADLWKQYLTNWVTGSPDADLAAATAPTHLVFGERDSFVTEDYLSGTVAALPNATIEGLPDAGHYPMIEQPAASVARWETLLGATKDEQ